MSAPIDILLKPLPNLLIHSAIFIGTIIIIWFWFSEIPWIPIFAFPTFALFNLLLSIRNKMTSNPIDTNPADTNPPANTTEGEEEEEEVEGSHEVTQQAKGGYHTGGSTDNNTPAMGTTYPVTQTTQSPEVASVEDLAKKSSDIKDRLGNPKKPYTDDMDPKNNSFTNLNQN